MKYCNDFSHDLKLGNKGENLIAKILMLEGSKIEVKTDFHAIKGNATGNVFVEYSFISSIFFRSIGLPPQ